MKVYNTNFLRGNQRVVVAIIAGLVSAIGCAILYALVVSLLGFTSSLLYVAMAYAISYCVRTYGRGVEVKFCIIGLCCTIFSILLGEMLWMWVPMGMNLLYLPAVFVSVIYSFLQVDLNSMIHLICIGYALYLAYYNSRIV